MECEHVRERQQQQRDGRDSRVSGLHQHEARRSTPQARKAKRYDARSRIPSLRAKQYFRDAHDSRKEPASAIYMETNVIENVIGFDALYDSMHKCKKGVVWKDSVASFYMNGIERTMKLNEELHDGTYKARKPVRFMITSPKPREIASITFRDRVYQRSLNDNVVYPVMSKSFIYDNYACQKGKLQQLMG